MADDDCIPIENTTIPSNEVSCDNARSLRCFEPAKLDGPFVGVILGGEGCGKSEAAVTIVKKRRDVYGIVIDRAGRHKEFYRMRLPHFNYYPDYDEAPLKQIDEMQRASYKENIVSKNGYGRRTIKSITVILDECTDAEIFSPPSRILRNLFMNGRCLHITTLVLAKKLRYMPVDCRSLVDFTMLGPQTCTDPKEFLCPYTGFNQPPIVAYDNLVTLVERETKKPYTFVVVSDFPFHKGLRTYTARLPRGPTPQYQTALDNFFTNAPAFFYHLTFSD